MNIQNEIRKINHDSILDFDLKLNNDEISELDNDDNSELNKIDSLLDLDFFYDFQFRS